jgi:hypothetical protein
MHSSSSLVCLCNHTANAAVQPQRTSLCGEGHEASVLLRRDPPQLARARNTDTHPARVSSSSSSRSFPTSRRFALRQSEHDLLEAALSYSLYPPYLSLSQSIFHHLCFLLSTCVPPLSHLAHNRCYLSHCWSAVLAGYLLQFWQHWCLWASITVCGCRQGER